MTSAPLTQADRCDTAPSRRIEVTKTDAIALYAAACAAYRTGHVSITRLNVAYQQAIDLGATEQELTDAARQAVRMVGGREPAP